MAFNVFKGKRDRPKKRAGVYRGGGLPKGVTVRPCLACGRTQRKVMGAQETCSACGGALAS
jgi:hypothetical protein